MIGILDETFTKRDKVIKLPSSNILFRSVQRYQTLPNGAVLMIMESEIASHELITSAPPRLSSQSSQTQNDCHDYLSTNLKASHLYVTIPAFEVVATRFLFCASSSHPINSRSHSSEEVSLHSFKKRETDLTAMNRRLCERFCTIFFSSPDPSVDLRSQECA